MHHVVLDSEPINATVAGYGTLGREPSDDIQQVALLSQQFVLQRLHQVGNELIIIDTKDGIQETWKIEAASPLVIETIRAQLGQLCGTVIAASFMENKLKMDKMSVVMVARFLYRTKDENLVPKKRGDPLEDDVGAFIQFNTYYHSDLVSIDIFCTFAKYAGRRLSTILASYAMEMCMRGGIRYAVAQPLVNPISLIAQSRRIFLEKLGFTSKFVQSSEEGSTSFISKILGEASTLADQPFAILLSDEEKEKPTGGSGLFYTVYIDMWNTPDRPAKKLIAGYRPGFDSDVKLLANSWDEDVDVKAHTIGYAAFNICKALPPTLLMYVYYFFGVIGYNKMVTEGWRLVDIRDSPSISAHYKGYWRHLRDYAISAIARVGVGSVSTAVASYSACREIATGCMKYGTLEPLAKVIITLHTNNDLPVELGDTYPGYHDFFDKMYSLLLNIEHPALGKPSKDFMIRILAQLPKDTARVLYETFASRDPDLLDLPLLGNTQTFVFALADILMSKSLTPVHGEGSMSVGDLAERFAMNYV